MRHAVRLSTTAVATAALAIGTAGSAAANTTILKDRKNDVVVNGVVGGKGAQLKDFSKGLDVESVRLRQGTRRVVLTIKFHRLRKSASPEVGIRFQVGEAGSRSSSALYSDIVTNAPKAYTIDTDGASGVLCANDEPALQHITTTAKYGKNGYFRIQMPRSCAESTAPSAYNATLLRARVEVSGSYPGKIAGEEGVQGFDYVSRKKTRGSSWTGSVYAANF